MRIGGLSSTAAKNYEIAITKAIAALSSAPAAWMAVMSK